MVPRFDNTAGVNVPSFLVECLLEPVQFATVHVVDAGDDVFYRVHAHTDSLPYTMCNPDFHAMHCNYPFVLSGTLDCCADLSFDLVSDLVYAFLAIQGELVG